jgi:peptidoglycan hydrolase-like protein with peptidoglycan-binding domain
MNTLKIISIIALLALASSILPSNNVAARPLLNDQLQSSGCSNNDADYSRATLYAQTTMMSGPDVVYLQARLLELGYSLPIGGADGFFGMETDAAVKEFQSNNGLTVDGAVGPITWACLNNPNATRGGSSSQNPPQNPQPPSSSNSVCGQYIVSSSTQTGFGGWDSYFFITSSNIYGFSSNAPFSQGYYRLYDPVMVPQYSSYTDGSSIDTFITGWSSYESLSGFDSCSQSQQQPQQYVYPTFTPRPLPTWTPIPSPADVRITNFTLADQLYDFSSLTMPIVFRPNVLWIQISNVGESTFVPPSQGGEYQLQVVLKQPGGKLEEYDYNSGKPATLNNLGTIYGGDSQTVSIADLFFFKAVDSAQLEVFFAPNANLGIKNSVVVKDISIKQHPDEAAKCAVAVAQATLKIAKYGKMAGLFCLNCKDFPPEKDLVLRMGKCSNNTKCAAEEASKWLISNLLKQLGDAGQMLALGSDALFAMHENPDRPPTCLIATDFMNAFLRDALRKGFLVNGIATESPVYPLVIDGSGLRTGFLSNGQIVEEIPNSHALILDEKHYVMYPGTEQVTVQVFGYADGEMNLYATFSRGTGNAVASTYINTPVYNGMLATLNSSDEQLTLQIDRENDGTIDQSIAPDELIQVTESGDVQQTIESVTQPSQESPSELDNSTPPPSGICFSPLAMSLPLAVVLVSKRKRKTGDEK